MTRYDLKKNLKDRLSDGSVLMIAAATFAILFMNTHQSASADPGAGLTEADRICATDRAEAGIGDDPY